MIMFMNYAVRSGITKVSKGYMGVIPTPPVKDSRLIGRSARPAAFQYRAISYAFFKGPVAGRIKKRGVRGE